MDKHVFVVNSLGSGVIENYLLRFIKFKNKSISSIVICKSGKLGILSKEFQKYNAKVVSINLNSFSFLNWFKLYICLKKIRPISITDFTGDFSGIILLISYIANVKCRVAFYRGTMHRFKPTFLKMGFVKTLNYLVKIFATNILSNSNHAFKVFFNSKIDSRFKVIYNGINFKELKPKLTYSKFRKEIRVLNSSFLIAHVGRFDISKNHKTILEFIKCINKNYSNVYFLFVGEGVQSGLTNVFNFRDFDSLNIRFINYTDDIASVFRSIDMFYFPSLTEGQPNALIEALVMGVPTVTSNIPTIQETVPLEVKEFLVSPLEVDKALYFFNQIKNKNFYYDTKLVRQKMIKKHDPNLRFSDFYNILKP